MHLDEMLRFNEQFVTGKEYEAYATDTYPNKKMVIVTCMDSRLVELLNKALNIQNGDVKMIKNAGAIIRDPFDSVMKSVLVAIYNLKADEVVLIGHHKCGMSHANTEELKIKMIERGVSEEKIAALEHAGIKLDEEFRGFQSVEDSVSQSVEIIRNHPLLPEEVKVHGLVIDPDTGKIDVVTKED